jgi:protein HIRA/HIR1
MLVDKPPWVVHEEVGKELYGIDVCADARRFATAGGDHKVKVWALPPVLTAAAEKDASSPRLLATLADHCGPVNALRFSHSGRKLATGSDDKLVLVHELRGGAPRAVFGSTGPPAVENWQARCTCAAGRRPPARPRRPCVYSLACWAQVLLSLRGHANNVTDVSWSPDDTLLASASLDNLIFVWDAQGNKVATLAGA